MDTDVVNARATPVRDRALEARVTLSTPHARLQVRLPDGEAGRAEAILGDRSWAAKHYWRGPDGLMTYEFDEPLPAGELILRVPLAPPAP